MAGRRTWYEVIELVSLSLPPLTSNPGGPNTLWRNANDGGALYLGAGRVG